MKIDPGILTEQLASAACQLALSPTPNLLVQILNVGEAARGKGSRMIFAHNLFGKPPTVHIARGHSNPLKCARKTAASVPLKNNTNVRLGYSAKATPG